MNIVFRVIHGVHVPIVELQNDDNILSTLNNACLKDGQVEVVEYYILLKKVVKHYY